MAEKILAAIAALTLFIVVGVIGYQEIATHKVTVDVQLKKGEDPFQTIRSIVPSGSTVIDVREVDREKNEYQLTVSTKQKKPSLLEWLRKSNRVERAEECSK